jgi:hypothetical protein
MFGIVALSTHFSLLLTPEAIQDNGKMIIFAA